MDKVSLIIPLIAVVLIIRQFIPKQVNRFDLIGLPILGAYKTYSGLPEKLDILIIAELFCLLAWAAIIGYYQAKNTKVVYHNDTLSTIGGFQYIIAWIVLLIGRMILLLLFNFSPLTEAMHSGSLANEIKDLVTRSGDWLIWSSVAASSIMYSLTLYLKHPEIKEFIRAQLKQN